jgi:hypothetical protein
LSGSAGLVGADLLEEALDILTADEHVDRLLSFPLTVA